jgi:hypothetical protein
LKADVNEFDSLKLISGMGWNEEKGTVTAIEEVWDTLLAVCTTHAERLNFTYSLM